MNTFENGFINELEKIARIPSVHRAAVTKALKAPDPNSAIQALPEGVQPRAEAKRWGRVAAKYIATPTSIYERAWNKADDSSKDYMRRTFEKDLRSGASLKKAKIEDAKSLGQTEARRYKDRTSQPSLTERLAAHKKSKAPPPRPQPPGRGSRRPPFFRGLLGGED